MSKSEKIFIMMFINLLFRIQSSQLALSFVMDDLVSFFVVVLIVCYCCTAYSIVIKNSHLAKFKVFYGSVVYIMDGIQNWLIYLEILEILKIQALVSKHNIFLIR